MIPVAGPTAVTVISALLSHLYFNRYEPRSPKHALSVLLGVPSLLLLLDAYLGRSATHTQSAWKVPATFATYFATLIGSIAAYRISPFHPLAKYPGPLIAKLSKFWMFFVCSTGKQHEYYARLHKKYGDIVRTGPNEVVIRDPAAVLPLMGTAGWGKGTNWEGRTMGAPIPPLIGIRDGAEHAKRRRTWNRGFNPTALKQYEPMVHKRVLQLSEEIMQRGRVDLGEMFGCSAFDIMADMALGGGTDTTREGDSEGIQHIIETGMRGAALLGHVPWASRYVRNLPGIAMAAKRLRTFSMQKFFIRKNGGSGQKDLFYHLADEAGIEKQPIQIPIVLSDSVLVIVAGSDTTATALSALFFYLLQDPKKFERLRAEIDKFYPREERITTEHFDQMVYLEACINEALRLSPPVPSGSPRAALHPDPSRGKMIGPYYIPEGTMTSVNFLAIQCDPKNFFPFPDTFWPDRWLVAKGLIEPPIPREEFIHDTSAFVPFSFGPSGCVGKPLALLELRMFTANIVRDIDLKFAPGYKGTWESDLKDYFVVEKGELPVIATPRA